MAKQLLFEAEAEHELDEAAQRYDEQRPGLGMLRSRASPIISSISLRPTRSESSQLLITGGGLGTRSTAEMAHPRGT